jgi:hypothetical protein
LNHLLAYIVFLPCIFVFPILGYILACIFYDFFSHCVFGLIHVFVVFCAHDTWCMFNVWSCFFVSNHHHYMCYHCQCSLHHICANQVNNDDVHQGSKSFLVVRISTHCLVWWKKRWETSLWTCAPLSKTIVATISRIIHSHLISYPLA